MHLKVCPNTKCGKVSDVGALVCESCGRPFPKIDLVPVGTGSTPTAAQAQQVTSDPVIPRDKPRTAAWPLIMVAIVAGGLPLLWANRSLLPTPRTWQAGPPDSTKTERASPAPVVAPQAPAAATPTLAVPAPQSPPVPAPRETAPERPVPSSAVPAGAAKTAATHDSTKSVAKAPPVEKKEPPRPCTEATIALGLCDPKQAAK